MLQFEILARGLYLPEQLVVHYDSALRMPITPEILAWMDAQWEHKLKLAREQKSLLYESQLFRFVSLQSCADGTLQLVLGDTTYKEYVTSRTPEFAQGRTRHALGNAMAVCSVVETSDGAILLDKRQGVDGYQGRYHVIGGFFERERDMAGVVPDPFSAMRREIREETGIQSTDIVEAYCLGGVYDLGLPHGELCFLHRLHIPLSTALTRQPEDNEIQQLLTLHVTATSLRDFILTHHGNISATGEANLLLYGGWKYGEPWFHNIMCHLCT